MTITLVRHGEVDEAFHRCYNGHNDIALSANGKKEAQRLAQVLQNHHFDAIYSSDLRRCQETVAPIINQLNPATAITVTPAKAGVHEQQHSDNSNSLIPASAGMTATSTLWTEELNKNPKEYFQRSNEIIKPIKNLSAPEITTIVIPVQTGIHEQQHSGNPNSLIPASAGMTATYSPFSILHSPFSILHFPCSIPHFPSQALREKSWGRHEGMTFDAIIERDGLVYENFEQWINALDGEPYDAYIERIRHFFTLTLPQTGYNNVLVITHAGVIRVLMHILQKITFEEAFSIDFPYSAYTTLDSDTWKFGETVCVS